MSTSVVAKRAGLALLAGASLVLTVGAAIARWSPASPAATLTRQPIPGIDKRAGRPNAPAPWAATASEKVARRQSEFLERAAEMETGEWRGLSPQERDRRRAALKLSFLGDD